MMLVRLKRRSFGGQLSYAIVVCSSKSAPSSGKNLEKLGFYNPLINSWGNKHLTIDFDRLQFWLERGAKIHINLYVLLRPIIFYNLRVSSLIQDKVGLNSKTR